MIPLEALTNVVSVLLPAATTLARNSHCENSVAVLYEASIESTLYVLDQRQKLATTIRLDNDQLSIVVCLRKTFRSSGASYEIHAPQAAILNGVLELGQDAAWKAHPALTHALDRSYPEDARRSWVGAVILKEELLDDNGEATQYGFRLPQVGALHAISAHWSIKNAHAKIVLPTGTGKTDVMIASMLMMSARRTLLLVPSDPLRSQAAERFSTCGILKNIGVVPESALNPAVGKLLRTPSSSSELLSFKATNIVVSTTQMLLGASDEVLREFFEWFDLVLFDEAHHLPSASWTRISKLIPADARVLSVTATPYRNDKRRVPGDLIYQFPLKMAQQLGYFTKIAIIKIDEQDPERADVAIAEAAIEALRKDESERGLTHLIMARARRKEHADALFQLYSTRYPELEPVLLYHGLSAGHRKNAVEGIKARRHRVVICVDMLGEGIDIAALKIAALHDSHKSLPVTLQFIGRFTRSSSTTGDATVIINVSDPQADSAVAELFAEDSDWNEILPQLSAKAIGKEEAVASFLAMMRGLVDPEDKKFDLGLVSAKPSAWFYTAQSFDPGRIEKALSKSSRLHQSWISEERDLIIFVTQDLKYPTWTTSREAISFDWNLTIVAFDENAQLLYMNSTHGDARNSSIARAVAGPGSTRVSGERMFRVFDGLYRSILYNVGLYRKGQLRFQMLAGKDIGDQIPAAIQAGSTKSNLFAVGYDDGHKVSIGGSFKGRVWSMGALSIEEWRTWCSGIAGKIKDESIATNSFLKFTLIPHEITHRPDIRVFACVLPDELLLGLEETNRKVSVDGDTGAYSQLDLSFDKITESGNDLLLEVSVSPELTAVFAASWNPSFQVSQRSGPRFWISDVGAPTQLEQFLTEHPPAMLLADGSEIVGRHHFQYPGHLPYSFSPESILPLDWTGVPITTESKWKNRVKRPRSVQGHMIALLVDQENTIVFDDDDTGEASDIIVLKENRDALELEIALFHCKYASGAAPGARVSDLYEVCGQAVKSSRQGQRADVLLKHMINREKRLRGRPTRFEKGSLAEIQSLLRRVSQYRVRVGICIVQPGLAASSLSDPLSQILAAADGFIFEFTGRRLKVYGSA